MGNRALESVGEADWDWWVGPRPFLTTLLDFVRRQRDDDDLKRRLLHWECAAAGGGRYAAWRRGEGGDDHPATLASANDGRLSAELARVYGPVGPYWLFPVLWRLLGGPPIEHRPSCAAGPSWRIVVVARPLDPDVVAWFAEVLAVRRIAANRLRRGPRRYTAADFRGRPLLIVLQHGWPVLLASVTTTCDDDPVVLGNVESVLTERDTLTVLQRTVVFPGALTTQLRWREWTYRFGTRPQHKKKHAVTAAAPGR